MVRGSFPIYGGSKGITYSYNHFLASGLIVLPYGQAFAEVDHSVKQYPYIKSA